MPWIGTLTNLGCDLRELILTFVSRGVPAAGAILFNIFVIRILNIDEAGNLFYWITNLYLIGFIATLGLDTYLLKKAATGIFPLARAEKRVSFILSTLISFAILGFMDDPAVMVLASLSIFAQVSINSKIIRGNGNYLAAGFYEPSSIFALSAFIGMGCVIAGLPVGMRDIVFILLGSTLGIFLITEFLVGQEYRLAKFEGIKFFHYEFEALSFAIFPLVIFATQWLPVYFLKQISNAEVSVYSISVRCASVLAFFALSMDSYVLPKIAKYHSLGQYGKIKKIIYKSNRLTVFLSIVSCFAYFVIGPVVVTSWAGEGYVDSYMVAAPILAMYFLSLILGPYQGFLLMSGQERYVNKANLVAFLIVVALCVLLTQAELLSAITAATVILIGRGIAIFAMWVRGQRLIAERLLEG